MARFRWLSRGRFSAVPLAIAVATMGALVLGACGARGSLDVDVIDVYPDAGPTVDASVDAADSASEAATDAGLDGQGDDAADEAAIRSSIACRASVKCADQISWLA